MSSQRLVLNPNAVQIAPENTSTTDALNYYFTNCYFNFFIIYFYWFLGFFLLFFIVIKLNINTPEGSVHVVASLAEGLDCVRDMSPDWIFIDNNLPDGKGVEAIQQIRDVIPGKRAKVVMMSAMTNLRDEAFRNGADFFLDKPISFVEVKNIFTKHANDSGQNTY